MTHTRSIPLFTVLLISTAFGSFACNRKVAAAPPAPSVAPAAVADVPTAARPTISIRTDRPALTRGQAATLTISSQNATSVTVEPGLGAVPLNGNRQVTPASSVTYVATAIRPGGTAGDTVRLTVNEPVPVATPIRAVTPNNVSSNVSSAPTLTMDQQIQRAMQPIAFDYDQADIRSDQVLILQSEAAFLKQNSNLRFTIEGHCDERGSEEYNLALGDRRANAVKQYLIGQGIAESRFNSVSYGEERPVCHEQSEDCYQRNRRAVFTRIP